jgi:hypothetical protein
MEPISDAPLPSFSAPWEHLLPAILCFPLQELIRWPIIQQIKGLAAGELLSERIRVSDEASL